MTHEERERLETDLLIVGGGPAGLAAAIHFARRLAAASATRPGARALEVMLVEKAADFGAHSLSGAVFDGRALTELLPGVDWASEIGATPCAAEALELFTERGALRAPWLPPSLRSTGLHIVSLSRLVRRLAQEAEALGVQLAAGFAAAAPLLEGGRLVGVRMADRGRDKLGQPKAGFEPGADVQARLTIVAEGARGSLTGQLVRSFGLDQGRLAPTYALGFKDLWELAPGRLDAGSVLHTLGYPLDGATFGGGFVYAHDARLASVGLVAGLDYRDPRLDPLERFEAFKAHPRLARLLAGGQRLRFGARTLNEGGYYAAPRPYGEGFLLAGEGAGLLDVRRLKGIHLALQSGSLAAETALEALVAGDTSAAALAAYATRLDASPVGSELRLARNFRQAFKRGRLLGLVQAGVQAITAGHGLRDPLPPSRGFAEMRRLDAVTGRPGQAGRVDRPAAVYLSGTTHEEDQPSHLLVADAAICVGRCATEYGNPCERFCPAGVYEIVTDTGGLGGGPKAAGGGGARRLLIHANNCLHCKTCEIMDPYQIITWTPPEGGGGPRFEGM